MCNNELEKNWKNYPVLITSGNLSNCCKADLILVQSMEGGFVTQNCIECGEKYSLSEYELKGLNILIICPICKAEAYFDIKDKNYVIVCSDCRIYLKFADILPFWSEIFQP